MTGLMLMFNDSVCYYRYAHAGKHYVQLNEVIVLIQIVCNPKTISNPLKDFCKFKYEIFHYFVNFTTFIRCRVIFTLIIFKMGFSKCGMGKT